MCLITNRLKTNQESWRRTQKTIQNQTSWPLKKPPHQQPPQSASLGGPVPTFQVRGFGLMFISPVLITFRTDDTFLKLVENFFEIFSKKIFVKNLIRNRDFQHWKANLITGPCGLQFQRRRKQWVIFWPRRNYCCSCQSPYYKQFQSE